MGFMAKPGWYPDPDGSGTPRYWNGERWEDPVDGNRPRRKGPWALGTGLLTLILVVAVILWQPWKNNPWSLPTDGNSSRPTGSQWDETEPTNTPTSPGPSDGGGRPVACPIVPEGAGPQSQNGWFSSGGMKYQGVPGWRENSGHFIDFASERSGQDDHVAGSWVAVTAIGQLSKKDYSPDPRTAAQQLVSCLSTSYYYSHLSRVEVLEDKSFRTSDGVSGWLIRANFWNEPGYYEVLGDEAVVVIVDQGAGDTVTLFHTQAPINDSDRQALVKASLDSLGRV